MHEQRHSFSSGTYNEIYTWGTGVKGKLGLDKKEKSKKPKIIKQLKGLGPIFIEVGEYHSAVITNGGKDVYMWGSGEKGQLGRGDNESQSVPRLVITLRDKHIAKICCGSEHTIALTVSGVVYAFGSNASGQLSLKNAVKSNTPEIVRGPWESLPENQDPIVNIAAGPFNSAAISRQGKFYLWGSAADSILLDENIDQFAPFQPKYFQNINVSRVSFGTSHCMVLSASGQVYSWGSNKYGQVGINSNTPELITEPKELVAPFKDRIITDVVCGNFHTLFLTKEAEVYSCGSGVSGQTGLGTRSNYYVPKKIEFPPSIKGDAVSKIACGTNFSVCITEKGRMYSFGSGAKGQLGHGDAKDYITPKLIETMQWHLIQSISCGGESTAALTGRNGKTNTGISMSAVKETKTLKIFTATYNINAQKQCLSNRSLLTILGEEFQEPPDIIAIGFQELVKLNGKEVAKDVFEEASAMKGFTEGQIEAVLKEAGLHYVQILSRQLVGLMLCIYVKGNLLEHIKRVQWEQERVGVMNKMGNKGGIACRMDIFGTQFCFVTSHMAAGSSKTERRNQDFKNIVNKIKFPTSGTRDIGILDHENIFWFGDFNYRLDCSNREFVMSKVEDFQYLLQYDQLNIEKQAERTFVGFTEGPLTFPPTYKYDPFTTVYDTGEKQRIPAWCDRILYKGEAITQIQYKRHELLPSDHRPVSALFVVDVKVKEEEELIEPPDHQLAGPLLMCQTIELPDLVESSSAHPQARKSVDEGVPIYAKVIFSYTPDNEKELELIENELVKILKIDSSGWWKAEKNGKQGWVPKDYVVIVDPSKIREPKGLTSLPEYVDDVIQTRNSQIGTRKSLNNAVKETTTPSMSNFDPNSIIKQGFLKKRGHLRKNWKSRFFILKQANLTYFASQYMDKIPLGVIDLRECTMIIRELSEDKKGNTKNFFRICLSNKDYEIDAGTTSELESWMDAIQLVLIHYSINCTIK